MLSLVSYGSSDESDGEDNRTENEPETKGNTSKNKSFSVLPTPKTTTSLLDIDRLLFSKPLGSTTSTVSIKEDKIQGKRKMQISIPALPALDEDLPRPTVQKTLETKSGLFSILPPPVHSTMKEPSRKLTPDVIRNKVSSIPKKLVVKRVSANPKDSDESDNEESDSNFFNINESAGLSRRVQGPERNHMPTTINPSMNTSKPEGVTEEVVFPVQRENLQLNNEAIMQLCGNKRRRIDEHSEIIDINEDQIRPDVKDWMIKQLTQETNQLLEKMNAGPEPCNLAKRKHQITYLAHEAKANEIQLKNQWAQNRISRQQTQSKYGF